MATFVGSPLDSVDLIAKGIQADFYSMLRKRLVEVAEEVAREATNNITARVQTYHRYMDGTVQVHVQFNGVPKP